MTAGEVLVERLIDWGVDVVFGLPGDGINGIMEALRVRQDKVRFIQVRHEESAAFMACGYAKFTGRLGVCLALGGSSRDGLGARGRSDLPTLWRDGHRNIGAQPVCARWQLSGCVFLSMVHKKRDPEPQ